MSENAKKIIVIKHNDNYTVNFLEENEQKNFLQDFLYSKFKEKDHFAYIEDRNLYFEGCENYINLGYFVNCGDLCIVINDENLLPDVVSVVDKYNKERESAKKLQLKMEGF